MYTLINEVLLDSKSAVIVAMVDVNTSCIMGAQTE
jgi:hypothetical protein